MLVWDLDKANNELAMAYSTIVERYLDVVDVPDEVITRQHAAAPGAALATLAAWQQERVTAC
jgi:hypothetical protein